MNLKTFALAGAAAFALTASLSYAQNDPAASPAPTDSAAPSTDATAPATNTAAPAKKHHKHHKKAAMSETQEEQTTAQLNQQQAQNPGTTASAPAGSGTGNSDMGKKAVNNSMSQPMNGAPADNSNTAKPMMGGTGR